MSTLYNQWVNTLSNAGIKPMSDDTAAKVLAIVYVYAGSMELIFNDKMKTDIMYAKKRAGLDGGKIHDPVMMESVRKYIKDLETFLAGAKKVGGDCPLAIEHPQWVKDFMSEKYDIKKLWL